MNFLKSLHTIFPYFQPMVFSLGKHTLTLNCKTMNTLVNNFLPIKYDSFENNYNEKLL